jgi:hypothetical protein
MKDSLEKEVHFFGYAKQDGNPFGFFDYDGKAKQENLDEFEGFKKLNEETLNWLRTDKEAIEKIRIPIN